ncbi:MAG: PIN domain nuclease [Acidobacteriota bacterium]|nr:PIN domain nuclease [Acidobacteriota bacterium]MDH3528596.1 PIN domain nuclease [Acidobacteriota bacterium]
MILVDSSVWIDYFNGFRTQQTDVLDARLATDFVIMGDLILAEVLQGFGDERDFQTAKELLTDLGTISLCGKENALKAASNYRYLRKRGTTARKTIDTLIATFCIEKELPLLYSDRDFDPFVEYLGLVSVE